MSAPETREPTRQVKPKTLKCFERNIDGRVMLRRDVRRLRKSDKPEKRGKDASYKGHTKEEERRPTR